MVDVFTYLDYRMYLQEAFAALKSKRNSFSHRAFARLAGFSSSNFMLLVMQGKRNLSSEAIQKVAGALKLRKKEIEFFENLVRFNQSKTNDERNFYYSRIIKNREYAQARPLEREQYKYYSAWYVPVIREMVLLDNFREDPQWIAESITPKISEREAREAIDLLLATGLLTRNESGQLIQQSKHVTTGDEVRSLALANFQKQMIELAAESIEKTSGDKREISSLTFCISPDRMRKAKKMIQEFRSQLAGFLAEEDKGQAVYQFNMQLFNLSRVEGKE